MCYRTTSPKEKLGSTYSLDRRHQKISYAELLEATDHFSTANLIGVGSYGSVFKRVLRDDDKILAVKVFDLQRIGASRSFIDECEAMRNIRHRNLLKIFSFCSSLDFKGNDFKALVFEYMANGSLHKWLHPEINERGQVVKNLSMVQRLNVAIGVASALDYLHNHCQPPIVHRDLKPSNVLLDENMTTHVGNFGIAKLLSNDQSLTSSVAIKGSVGYVAPEYAEGGDASKEGDFYSYGIVILEIFTGKRPTDAMFRDGLNLHNFGKLAFPDQVMNIVDPHLLPKQEPGKGFSRTASRTDARDAIELNNGLTDIDAEVRLPECLASLLKVGICVLR